MFVALMLEEKDWLKSCYQRGLWCPGFLSVLERYAKPSWYVPKAGYDIRIMSLWRFENSICMSKILKLILFKQLKPFF
jgi:hypothetical protein